MSSLAQNLLTKLRDALVGLRTEESVLKKLHRSSKSTLARLQKLKPGLDDRLKEAHGYAVFPVVGEAALVAGAAYGTGEVFEQGSLVGYAALVQLSVGVQLGGDTFSQVILFHNKQSIDRFKQGKLAFSASAAAALVKGAVRGVSDYERDVTVLSLSHGGALIEASVGVQKFIFKSAALGRLKQSPAHRSADKRKRSHTRNPISTRKPRRTAPTRRS